MARDRAEHMNYGPPSLTRLECRTCGEVTLHKSNRCIHCETVFVPTVTSVQPKWNARAR